MAPITHIVALKFSPEQAEIAESVRSPPSPQVGHGNAEGYLL
jgi:hypothetical protein